MTMYCVQFLEKDHQNILKRKEIVGNIQNNIKNFTKDTSRICLFLFLTRC